MLNFTKIASLTLLLMLSVSSLFAQEEAPKEPSEGEITTFVDAVKSVQVVEQGIQQKMIEAVQNSGLTVERFNEIIMANQNPDQESDATEEEMKKVESAGQQIQTIQTSSQGDIQKSISEAGMTVERYQEIMMMVQSNQEMLAKVQKMLEE